MQLGLLDCPIRCLSKHTRDRETITKAVVQQTRRFLLNLTRLLSMEKRKPLMPHTIRSAAQGWWHPTSLASSHTSCQQHYSIHTRHFREQTESQYTMLWLAHWIAIHLPIKYSTILGFCFLEASCSWWRRLGQTSATPEGSEFSKVPQLCNLVR